MATITRRTGAYAKLLANYAEDDAVIEAGEKAELLFVRGLAFCADSDSDGFITDKQLTRIVGAGMRDARARARRLTEVGLWSAEDGGYLVRSWVKLHGTASERGRRLKADRERKNSSRTTLPFPPGQDAESGRNDDTNPSDSLSMTEQYTTVQDRALQDDSSLGEDRNETLHASPATEPSPSNEPTSPNDARCSAHRGVVDPGPCRGCMQARERAEKTAERGAERTAAAAERARAACPDCHGSGWREHDDGSPAGKCDHRRAAAPARSA